MSSTGVVDTANGVLYVVGASGLLHALQPDRRERGAGLARAGRLAARGPSTSGAGSRSSAARSTFRSPRTATRPTAAAFRRKADSSPYDVAQPSALPSVFDPVPGADNLGGVWGWGGVSVSLDGTRSTPGSATRSRTSTTATATAWSSCPPTSPRRSASNRPIASVEGEDVDLGAAPVLFKPIGCPALLAANDKSGDLVVWRQDGLAKGPYARIPLSDGVDAFVGAPSWSPRDADALRLDRHRD